MKCLKMKIIFFYAAFMNQLYMQKPTLIHFDPQQMGILYAAGQTE